MVFLSASWTAVTRLCRSVGQKHISAVSLAGMLLIITAFSPHSASCRGDRNWVSLAGILSIITAFLASFIRALFEYPFLQFNVIYSRSLNSFLTILIYVSGNCGQGNRRITFLTPVRGFYLEGHVISNYSVEPNLDCQDQCALARECVSYNIGPTINNKLTCELSNSDHLQHPEDLKPRKDWIYRGTQVHVERTMAQPNFKNSLSLCSNDLLEFYFKTVSVIKLMGLLEMHAI